MASPPQPAVIKRKRSDASDHSSQAHNESVSPTTCEEVANDFSDALNELSGNDRYAISNLSVVAREHLVTNLAQANANANTISNVLISHIGKVGPSRKLPALYVLDSIVKNVGQPYNTILARSLWKTFMDAYTLVDPTTRKQMESMLKTWKDPVSIANQTYAVFPQELTKSIENALIRARIAAEEQKHQTTPMQQSKPSSGPQQQQQQQQQQYPHQQQYHSSQSTPQQHNQQHTQQYNQQYTQQHNQQHNQQHTQQHNQQHTQQQPQSYYHPPAQQMPGLVSPPPSLPQSYHQQSQAHHYPSYQSQTTPQPYSNQIHSPPQYPNFQPPAPTPQRPNNLDLSALLQHATSNVAQYNTPPPQTLTQSYYPPPYQQQQQQQYPQPRQQPAISFPGLEALFQHQKPSNFPTPSTQHDRLPTPQPPSSSNTPVQSFLFTPPIRPAHLSSVPAIINNDATLTNASLKIHRPTLLATLYADRPRQCNTCGRRFAATAEGQARKSRHLDAHFRTNRKLAEMEDQGGRGVSRSWYVGEVDWIGAKEWDDADQNDPAATAASTSTGGLGAQSGQHNTLFDGRSGIPGSQGSGGNTATGQNAATPHGRHQSYIKAPVDAALTRYTCPICQDEFNAQWHDDAQEWVWMDALRIGDKVYHESCIGEMAKDRGRSAGPTPSNAAGRNSTPLATFGAGAK